MNSEEQKKFQEKLDSFSCPPLRLSVQPARTEPDKFRDYTPLQQSIMLLVGEPDTLAKILTASDHDFYCRCNLCKEWWRSVGPEEDGSCGPFTIEEILDNV